MQWFLTPLQTTIDTRSGFVQSGFPLSGLSLCEAGAPHVRDVLGGPLPQGARVLLTGL